MEADDMTSDAGPPMPALAADGPETPKEAERMDRQRDADTDLEPPVVGKHKLEHDLAATPVLLRNFTHGLRAHRGSWRNPSIESIP